MNTVPGIVELDANALSPQSLYLTLTNAASSNQQKISEGAQQLAKWEKQPGFYSNLQTIFIDTTLPLEIRYLAAIQIKNGIDKYWRKTATNAISKEEKNLIRSRCLESGINEADRRLALQNAIFVAKIVRFEYPSDWPDAITSVVQFLRDTAQEDRGSVHLPRTLLILLHIIKELSTARLQRSRVSLQQAAPEILQVLGTIYVDKVNSWMRFLKSGGTNEAGAINDIDTSLLALRVLRRLLICGFENPNRNASVQEFWSIIGNHFSEIFTLTMHHGQQLSVREQIEKHLIQISKLHLQMVRDHPAAFVQLSGSIDIAKYYWQILLEFSKSFGTQSITAIGTDGDAEDEITYIEKLSLKGLLLLRACVKMVYYPIQTFKYQKAEDKQERKESKDAMKDAILSTDMIREMMETLVTRFFVFRARDLREWEEEPSEWERREEGEGETWEFSVRVCAEKLFLDLVINNKEQLIQPLLQVFYSVATLEVTDVLYKDSIYAAIGLAAPVLESHLDFDTFLSTTLVPEVQANRPGYNILRRRIAIVLGQWIVVKDINRNLVYSIFEHILKKDDLLNDLVVRVTAGRQLKNVIDPLNIQVDQFVPHAGLILSRLGALIQEVELSETRLALLQTLNSVVVRMEHHVTPFANTIVSLLPPLWDQAGDEFLTKQVILGILSALVNSMKADSRQFHNIMLPLIESSIQIDSETRSWLLEDALDLWSAILAQADQIGDLLSLVKHIKPLFEMASDALRKGLEITEQYVLLAPQAMLEQSLQFTADFRDLISHMNAREARGVVIHIVDTLFQMATIIGGKSAVARLADIINESNFLQHILLGLKSAYDSHQTTGPNRVATDIEGIVETDYFTVLARILLLDPASFITVVSDALSEPIESILPWLLTEWFSHCESVGFTTQKKLMCLALTNLLDLPPNKQILDRLQEFMGLWTDTVAECMEYTEGEPEGRDTLVWIKPVQDGSDDHLDSPEQIRKQDILYADPVHTVHIKQHIRNGLLSVIERCGGQDAFQRDWLVNVDRDVVQSFSALQII